jgi:cytoskeletal protein RodZ
MDKSKSNKTPKYSFLVITFLTMLALVGFFVLVDSAINTKGNTAFAQSVPTPSQPESPTPTNIGLPLPGQVSSSSSAAGFSSTQVSNSQVPTSTSSTPSEFNPGGQTVRSGGSEIVLSILFISLTAGAVYLFYLKDQKRELKTHEKKLH